jgi:hypothetical protein
MRITGAAFLDDGVSSPLMIHVFDVADQIADDF